MPRLRLDASLHASDDPPVSPERRLAVAVLKTGVNDLHAASPTRAAQAVAWFRDGDHAVWCELVGLDPALVARHALSGVAVPCGTRKRRQQGADAGC